MKSSRQKMIYIDKILSKIGMSNRDKIFFVGTILVALSEKSYRDLYKSFELRSQDSLLRATVSALKRIAKTQCKYKKELYEIRMRFQSIVKKRLSATQEKDLLYRIIDLVASITSEHADYMSTLYSKFITSSSGNRTVTGIVLTPEHIAGLMATLLDIEKDDTVLDICCGCGTLLLAADRMTEAHAEYYGCEIDDEIYLLGVMETICQRANVKMINNNCFSHDVDKILHTKFSKGLLNPPYSHAQYSELQFLLRELDYICIGGEVAIICPTSCAMKTKYQRERQELMQKHTLQAVLSMPRDLFCGNGAFTYTCIMIWRAHIPHDINKKVYFACCDYDGFQKCGKLGRLDKNNEWESIKNAWITQYRDKEIIQGVTALHTVTVDDEWLPESYVVSNQAPEQEDFEKTLIEYLIYCTRTYGIGQEIM